MKIDKSIIVSFIFLVLIASLYRIMPGRPFGFAPQIAMALFSGSIIKDKKFSFLLPILSMLVSDIIYEVLFSYNISPIAGFYDGQVLNYILFAAVTVIGFMIKKENLLHIAGGSVAGATFYFITSNFVVWIGGGLALNNLPYAKTWDGLMTCFAAGLPFYQASLYSTLFFSAILFGGYFLFNKFALQNKRVTA
ncbi:MAG: hypothetical protein JWP81_3440 [Ferruginibacter sp.]|nr:hypothetical protein [Ferruginibacter sp.]